MSMNYFFLKIVGLFLLASAGASAKTTTTDFDLVFNNPGSYEDKWLTVRGFIRNDGRGHQYLFRSSRDAREKSDKNSIDLIAVIPGREKAANPLIDMACADIYGQFNSYGEHGVIPMGYMASDAGLITVARVSECPADNSAKDALIKTP